MRRAARQDANATEIANAFRGLGCSVEFLSPARRGGLPDLLCGYGRYITFLVEVKQPGQNLNPDQVRWHAEWEGVSPFVVRTLEDVGAIVRAIEAHPPTPLRTPVNSAKEEP